MRNQGSMRLILNTRLWAQMVIQRANRKSLCITATDLEDCSVKVFLIQVRRKTTFLENYKWHGRGLETTAGSILLQQYGLFCMPPPQTIGKEDE